MERFIQKFKKGGLYGIGARSGMGKTQFCISVTSLLASKGSKVLYMSNAMDEDEFFKRMKTDNLNICNKANFEEVYKLTLEGLKMFVSEDDYGLVVLDPFNIYSLDFDVGDIKTFAKKKNIAILLTTGFARPPFDDDRIHPDLSDIKFVDEKTHIKLIVFSELILFLTQEPNTNNFNICFAKNMHGKIGETI